MQMARACVFSAGPRQCGVYSDDAVDGTHVRRARLCDVRACAYVSSSALAHVVFYACDEIARAD